MATSCYSDLTSDFQQLEDTTGSNVKLLDISTGANTAGEINLYGTRKVAQRIAVNLTSTSTLLHGVRIKLKRVGAFATQPDAQLYVQLWSETTNQPDAPEGPTTAKIDVSSIPETDPAGLEDYIVFEFIVKPTFGTTSLHWIVLQFVQNGQTGNSSNYIQYYRDDAETITTPYSVTLYLRNSITSGSWSDPSEGGDMGIVVYATEYL